MYLIYLCIYSFPICYCHFHILEICDTFSKHLLSTRLY